LRAPGKQLIWFEDSAHNVPFEEPELFNETVVSALRSIAIRRQSHEDVRRRSTPLFLIEGAAGVGVSSVGMGGR
jgi:hypothetical protein